MVKNDRTTVALKIYLEAGLMPVATSFVEQTALAYGLGPAEAMKLTLAVEEIFTFLCGLAQPEETLEIDCENLGYGVAADLRIGRGNFNMRAFNLTASISPDDEASLEEMGLVLAARLVERLQVVEQGEYGLSLRLIKEKTYPAQAVFTGVIPAPKGRHRAVTPDPEMLKHFLGLVNRYYETRFFPPSFTLPGKVVDMAAQGEYEAVLAVDEAGNVGGGLIWSGVGQRTVECFGPYVFQDEAATELGEILMDACLGRIARTRTVGLFTRYATPALPVEYFESLGQLVLFGPQGPQPQPAYYRLLHEDPGCSVWSHQDLEEFLKQEYQRLVLPREIRLCGHQGENMPEDSVLAAELRRETGSALLHPLKAGTDARQNLAQHVRLLENEHLANIYFEMDLGQAWQTMFTPALLANDFMPRLVIPYGGENDRVVFQYLVGDDRA